MTDDARDFLSGGFRPRVSSEPRPVFDSHWAALTVAFAGAGAAALFICLHLSVAVILAATLLVLSLVENEAFLLVIIFLTPVGWILSSSFPIRNVHVLVHCLVVIGFFAGRLLRGQAETGLLFQPVISRLSLVFASVATISTLISPGGVTHEGARSVIGLFGFIGFYFVVIAWVNTRERMVSVLWTLLLSTTVTAVFAIYQQVVGGFTGLWLYLYPPDELFEPWGGRSTSFLNHPNLLAGYLNTILPFALACYFIGRGKWRTVGGCTFLLGAIALFSTQSLGGILAFFSILVLAIWYFASNLRVKLGLIAGVAISISLLYLLRSIVNPNHTEDVIGSDAVTRLLIWSAAWDLFVRSPVIGVGWGNFANFYDMPSVAGLLAAHSVYLQLLAETGLLGLASFLGLFVRSWWQALRQWRSALDPLDTALAFGVLGAIISVLVHGFVDFPLTPQQSTLVWILMALLVVSSRLQVKAATESLVL